LPAIAVLAFIILVCAGLIKFARGGKEKVAPWGDKKKTYKEAEKPPAITRAGKEER